jgi:tetratricopeptide (TPR) repeat protein
VFSSIGEAAELLRHAQDLSSRGRTEAAAAIAITITEHTGEPGDDADMATPSGDALGDLLLHLGALFRSLAMPDRAAAVLPRAVRRFERSAALDDVGRRGEALRQLGLAQRDLGRLDEAEATLRSALDGDLSYAEVPSIVRSLRDLATVLAALGKFTSASKCYEWAVQQAMALEERELEAIVRHAWGELLLTAGRADIAFLKFCRAFNIFRQLGDDDGLACSARGLGDVALGGGRGAEARASFLQMLALGQQNERPSLEGLALIRRAVGFRTDGLLDDAERELEAARVVLEPRATGASELPERLWPFVPAPADLLSAWAHELGFTLACRGSLDAAEDLAHRALQMRSRRKDRELWKTCALLARIAAARGEAPLARTWSERAGAAFRPAPALARAQADVALLVDALQPLLATAQAARRSIDPWLGDAFPLVGAGPHEAELRAHLGGLADPVCGAPIPSADLPAPVAAALREAWKLGPWPEDDLAPGPADDGP